MSVLVLLDVSITQEMERTACFTSKSYKLLIQEKKYTHYIYINIIGQTLSNW